MPRIARKAFSSHGNQKKKENENLFQEKSSTLMNLYFSEVDHGDKDRLEGVGFDDN
jgi:hypothetical protein